MRSLRKVALGMHFQAGAFGGGQRFGRSFAQHLSSQGMTVVHDLRDDDIDSIILTDTRPWTRSGAFTGLDVQQYLRRHPSTQILLRVNECDQRKGRATHWLNHLVALHGELADHIVFVSDWLKNLYLIDFPHLASRSLVIPSAASDEFHTVTAAHWRPPEPLRIVTHHWSSNWYKGWDIYQRLDHLIASIFGDAVQFTFIGQPWTGVPLTNTTLLPPLSGVVLAKELARHHVYVSGSQNEPAGMHFIEALACGLPILYRLSGSLPEYCRGYGVPFHNEHDLLNAVRSMQEHYEQWRSAVLGYTYTATDMIQQYIQLLEQPHPRLAQRVQTSGLHTVKILGLQSAIWLRDTLTA